MANENAAILVIAPGRSISKTARRIIAEKGLEVGVETANDDLALAVLKRHPEARVVVSRGGTSKSLRSVPGITVVDICASFADIASAVQKLLDRGCRRISVVSQDNLIDPGVVKLQVGGAWISTHPCANSEEIVQAVRRCSDEGSDGIAGCYVATGEARHLGIPSEFIDENEASLAKYLDEAVRIEAATRLRDLQIDCLNSVINHIGEGVAIFGEDREAVFANDTARRLLEGTPQDGWYPLLAGGLEPFCISYHGAVTRGRAGKGDTVLVIGAGTIGTLAAVAAKSQGATVYISDVAEKKLNYAVRTFGLDGGILNTGADFIDRCFEITKGRGFDVAIEAVGLPGTFQNAIDAAAFGGRVVLIGVGKKNLDFNFTLLQKKELNVFGSRNALKQDFLNLIDLVKSGKVDISKAVTNTYALDDAPRAFDEFDRNGADMLKVEIDFTK
ncbi:MAG: zinc-binding dehydrogenase [Aeromonadales bacterium]|nr:zinc-binding dehydrogenase [Aeromonadales bacterium]